MKLTLIVTIASVMMLGASCEKTPSKPVVGEDSKGIELTKSQQAVLDEGQEFNFDFLRYMSKNVNNVFISPFSLQAALSMSANGAKDNTCSEMLKAIGYDGRSIEEVNAMYGTMVSSLLSIDKSTTLEIANALWVNKGFPVREDYVKTLEKVYGAECSNLDFGSSAAVPTINGWCDEKTHGMIKEILDSIDPQMRTLLANALYFKGVWVNKFDEHATVKKDFKTIGGSTKKVDMMRQTADFRYAVSDEAQFVAMPFGNKAFELDIVLPKEGVNFKDYVKELDSKTWSELVDRASTTEVILSVPKISMEYYVDLIPFLQASGMNQAFTGAADFSGLSSEPTCIGMVRQKAVFKMDEKGAEAAAVTIIGNKVTSVGPSPKIVEFTADHPFIFAIRERSTSAILFIGTYAE